MTKRVREQIEWAFKNYEANRNCAAQDIARDVAETGITARYDLVGGSVGNTSDPTAINALRLSKCSIPYLWAKVVENTYATFRFEPEYEVMLSLYVEQKRYKDILKNINESTFWYWRDRWLRCALMWAEEYKLL